MEQRVAFSVRNRDAFLRKIRNSHFDLVVIGGGITGAGIALDAVSRGLSVCLIEKGDFSSGTSGKSTKLIHGGLRYLKQFEFGLVKEVGVERTILHRLAPHLVLPEKMLLPLIKGGSLGKTMTSIGLYIYDFLADVEGEDKRRMLNVEETLDLEPLLPKEKLLGGSLYAEYRTDDARLTIEVIKSAYARGAMAASYVRAISFIEDEGQVSGLRCKDEITGEFFEINASYVVNATGPWVDDVRRFSGPVQGKHLYLTKGSHIVLPHHRLPVQQSVYFDVPNDKRMIFAIPRLGVTYVGTTDTYYDADKDNISVSRSDCEYLLNAVNRTFHGINLQVDDIISSWSGIRPLIYEDGKSASEISRKDEIFEAENGLISIAGGKLTGYRKMSERVVDVVAKKIESHSGDTLGPCVTDTIPLTAEKFDDHNEVLNSISALKKKLDGQISFPHIAAYLVNNYGRDALKMVERCSKDQNQNMDEALLHAEIDYCIQHEMVVYPMDFLARRSGRMYFMPETIDAVKTAIFTYFGAEDLHSKDQLSKLADSWDLKIEGQTNFT